MRRRLTVVTALAVGATALIGPPAIAGPGKDGKGDRAGARGGQHGKRMGWLKELNLTDAQKARIKPILEKAQVQRKAIRENTTLSREQKATRMQVQRQATVAQIREVLTPKQRAKLDAQPSRARERTKARGAARS